MLGNKKGPDFPNTVSEQSFILPSLFLPVVHNVQQPLEFLHAFGVGGNVAAAGDGRHGERPSAGRFHPLHRISDVR